MPVPVDGDALAAVGPGQLSRTVAPFAHEALETGLGLGIRIRIRIRAGASLVAAVIATLGLRLCRRRRYGGSTHHPKPY
ncbi:hypothetical protein [Streptomyces europaeiscabiei]|uniref:hypothetical protein n=1 Tax=Streptomyces europaeiscabiei TaxID=146819 RepID=UPI0029B14CB6|nr:hypothetical protein [Streptomyces europaeiscabiei]MDX3712196.1 hypothetical protein [Streptomyces europaeiscabiei]MDX3865500.1 hypothetical protein [Streptomyces europaeiscabiei]MDX3872372.1 hypothetical protein [Streptomyces europaeiscabiei]